MVSKHSRSEHRLIHTTARGKKREGPWRHSKQQCAITPVSSSVRAAKLNTRERSLVYTQPERSRPREARWTNDFTQIGAAWNDTVEFAEVRSLLHEGDTSQRPAVALDLCESTKE